MLKLRSTVKTALLAYLHGPTWMVQDRGADIAKAGSVRDLRVILRSIHPRDTHTKYAVYLRMSEFFALQPEVFGLHDLLSMAEQLRGECASDQFRLRLAAVAEPLLPKLSFETLGSIGLLLGYEHPLCGAIQLRMLADLDECFPVDDIAPNTLSDLNQLATYCKGSERLESKIASEFRAVLFDDYYRPETFEDYSPSLYLAAVALWREAANQKIERHIEAWAVRYLRTILPKMDDMYLVAEIPNDISRTSAVLDERLRELATEVLPGIKDVRELSRMEASLDPTTDAYVLVHDRMEQLFDVVTPAYTPHWYVMLMRNPPIDGEYIHTLMTKKAKELLSAQ